MLEIALNDTIYTIERKFGKGSNQLVVYTGTLDALLRSSPYHLNVGSEFSDFILHKLGIPCIGFVDPYYDRETKLTFSDLYDTLYIDQERGFSEIYARIRGKEKRKNIFKFLTKTIHQDLYECEVEEKSLKRKESELKEAFQAVAKFLGSVSLPTFIEIQSKIDKLRIERVEVDKQLRNLKLQIRSNPAYVVPLREEVLQLENDVAEKQRELFLIQQTITAYAELENQLYEELDQAARIRISGKQLSSYDFERCPRCLQEITITMKRREAIGLCCLCERQLVDKIDDISDIESHEMQTNVQIGELHELQQYYQSQISTISEELKILQEQFTSKQRALDEATKEFVSPLIQQIESLGYKMAAIDEEILRHEQLHRWRERLQEMEEALIQISTKIMSMQELKKVLIEQENAMKSKLVHFESFLYQFLQDTYPGFEDVRIDGNDFLPLVNNYYYNLKSATQRDIVILGYYYALLRFSIENDSYIPRFLAIDTPRQDDLSENLYDAILKKYKELEDLYSDHFQLFLVLREPAAFLYKNERLQLVEGEKLLRLSGNSLGI